MRRSHGVETELLARCARTSLGGDDAERITLLLREPIDWDHLARLARAHKVVPLLHTTLGTVCPEAVPAAVGERLNRQFLANARQNLLLTHELLALLRQLSARGIPAVPYKGAVLATSVYGNLALRSFNDLDILVPRGEVLRVKDLLLAQGYQPEYVLTAAREAAYLATACEYNFNSPANIHVEVHWDILRPHFSFRPDTDVLWQRLGTTSLLGTDVATFAPEETLLVLSAHGAKHHWSQLSLVCDVAELLARHRELDWDRVLTEARDFRCRRVLALGVLLAVDVLGAEVPGAVATALERTLPRLLPRLARRRSLREPDGGSRPIEQFLMRLWVIDTAADRARHAVHYGTRTLQGRSLQGPKARLAQLERMR